MLSYCKVCGGFLTDGLHEVRPLAELGLSVESTSAKDVCMCGEIETSSSITSSPSSTLSQDLPRGTTISDGSLYNPADGQFYADHATLLKQKAKTSSEGRPARPVSSKPLNKDGTSDDVVKHPNHYTKGKIETWDYIVDQDMNYLEGNVIKYVTRYKHKNGLEDLKKAQAYLNKLIAINE